MEWQPIETAPKDGTVILLSNSEGFTVTGYWEDEWDEWIDSRGPTYGTNVWGNGLLSDISAPSHWMPLPAPPAQIKEG